MEEQPAAQYAAKKTGSSNTLITIISHDYYLIFGLNDLFNNDWIC